MAVTVGNVKVVINSDDSNYLAGLTRTRKTTSIFTRAMTGVWTAMGMDIVQSLKRVLFAPFKLALAGIKAGVEQLSRAVSDAMDLGTALAELSTLGVHSIDDLHDEVLAVSNALGETAVESTRAFYQALSAGVPEDNVFQFVETAGQAAVAGLTDTATMVDALSSVVAANSLEWGDASDVADKFFKTIQLGKTTAGELAPVIGRIAPAAAAANVGLDEMFGLLAAITRNGIQTNEAVTGLRGAMRFLIKPTGQAVEALEALGLEGDKLQEAIGREGLVGVLQRAQEAGVLNMLIEDVNGLNAAFAVLGNDGGMMARQLIDDVSMSAGVFSEAFAEMASTAAFQWDKLKTQVTNVRLAIGEIVVELLGEMLVVANEVFVPIGAALREAVIDWGNQLSMWLHTPGDNGMSPAMAMEAQARELGSIFTRYLEGELTVKELLDLVGDWIDASRPAIREQWEDFVKSDVFQALKSGFEWTIEKLTPSITALFATLGELAGKAFAAAITSAIGSLASGAYEWVAGAPPPTYNEAPIRRGSYSGFGALAGAPVLEGPRLAPAPVERGASLSPGGAAVGGGGVTINVSVAQGSPDEIYRVINDGIRRGNIMGMAGA